MEAFCNINAAFGENLVRERTIRRWFEEFHSGDINLESEPRGRSKEVIDNDELRSLGESDTYSSKCTYLRQRAYKLFRSALHTRLFRTT